VPLRQRLVADWLDSLDSSYVLRPTSRSDDFMSEDFRKLERIQNHEEGHRSSRFYQDFEAFVRVKPLDMGYQPFMPQPIVHS